MCGSNFLQTDIKAQQPSVKKFAHVSRDNIKIRNGIDIIFSRDTPLTPFPWSTCPQNYSMSVWRLIWSKQK